METKERVAALLQKGKKVVIKRFFEAPCERVWDAWTSPELLARWFSADPKMKMSVLELDVRTGGGFRFVFSGLDGRALPGEYTGTYTVVDPPARLSFLVVDYSTTRDSDGISALFEVEFQRMGKQTQLSLTATLPGESYLENTSTAWNACFDNLTEILE